MRITISQLRRIIKEEVSRATGSRGRRLRESAPGNPRFYRQPGDGMSLLQDAVEAYDLGEGDVATLRAAIDSCQAEGMTDSELQAAFDKFAGKLDDFNSSECYGDFDKVMRGSLR